MSLEKSLVPMALRPATKEWRAAVTKYEKPSFWRATWQIVDSIVPYAICWYLIHLSLAVSIWLVLPLIIIAGGLLIRIFIIHHDCGHHSFYKSRGANDTWGYLTGVLTFTPYHLWRWEHAIHHANSGDLDRRGLGSVWTLTVKEYAEASWGKRLAYRLMRNPLILFGIGPLFWFAVRQRFATPTANRRERLSVYTTNLGLAVLALVMTWIFGFWEFFAIQMSIMLVAGAFGEWLFYVQHQFDGTYWERHEDWDYSLAAMEGSSFYKLPKILQWFSGNIGFHHIHHLSPRIPNYFLEKCHNAEPLFQKVQPLTLFGSLRCGAHRLWDEEGQKLVGFGYMRTFRRQQKALAATAAAAVDLAPAVLKPIDSGLA